MNKGKTTLFSQFFNGHFGVGGSDKMMFLIKGAIFQWKCNKGKTKRVEIYSRNVRIMYIPIYLDVDGTDKIKCLGKTKGQKRKI